jgi:hypothetical protein
MNLVRAYPTSIPMAAWGTPGEHQAFHRAADAELWDVDQFNDEFFGMFGRKVERLEEYGIIVHVQLWQIVFFKGGSTRWDANYINPRNNVNAWTRDLSRGSQYIDAPAGSRAREHQRQWVTRILDALKGRGNVIIDVINELGNEMGTLDWAVEVVDWIREWEAENQWQFVVGVDSEHHYHPDRFGPYQDRFDIIILNELRNPDHARQVVRDFGKPVVSVRSSDGTNRRPDYMFVDESQTGPEFQARYRTLCYRSLFAGLQSVGCYWKMPVSVADYRDLEDWPRYAEALRAFWVLIRDQWPSLAVDDTILLSETVTPHAYGLRAPNLHLAYLECGSHTWNNAYAASELVVRGPDRLRTVELYHPRTGEHTTAAHTVEGDRVRVALPEFIDDLVVILRAD